MVKSIPTLCYEIQAEARKMAVATDSETPNLTLRVHPEIAKALKTRESILIDELEQTARADEPALRHGQEPGQQGRHLDPGEHGRARPWIGDHHGQAE